MLAINLKCSRRSRQEIDPKTPPRDERERIDASP
jgi:hypothetical protein